MDLKQRLGMLRRQIGYQGQPDVRTGVAERVRRSRLDTGCRLARPAPLDPGRLAEFMEGEVLAPGVIVIERRVPLHRYHGGFVLTGLSRAFQDLPEARGMNPHRLVFLDTETSGLAGGTGTVVFLLGLARIDQHVLVVRQYLLTHFAGEAALLSAAADWLNSAEALVTFNGKSFDVPLLAARCRLAGVEDRFSPMPHLDLLHPTRRAFNLQWDDCRLISAERRLLKFLRTDDLPGAEAPAAWFAFIHRGDVARLPGVARHNHWDLVSLAALLPALDTVHAAPAAWGANVCAVARAQLATHGEEHAFGLLRAAAETLEADGLMELARLYRRRGRWHEACTIWERLAEQGSVVALERLAKYHEHERRDYGTALGYARRLPPDVVHEHRRRRLLVKLNGTALAECAAPLDLHFG